MERNREANIPSVLVLQQLSTDWRDFAVRLCYISHFLFVKFFLFWPLSFPFVLGIPHSSVFYCSFNNTPVPYPGNKWSCSQVSPRENAFHLLHLQTGIERKKLNQAKERKENKYKFLSLVESEGIAFPFNVWKLKIKNKRLGIKLVKFSLWLLDLNSFRSDSTNFSAGLNPSQISIQISHNSIPINDFTCPKMGEEILLLLLFSLF